LNGDIDALQKHCETLLESIRGERKPKTLRDVKVGDTLYSNIDTCIINKGQGYRVTKIEDGLVWIDTKTNHYIVSYMLKESDFYL
jgi:hypothetical protein